MHFIDTVNIYDVVGHHRQAIDRQASYTAYNLAALRELCKLFASVAQVCQRLLGFLVSIYFTAPYTHWVTAQDNFVTVTPTKNYSVWEIIVS